MKVTSSFIDLMLKLLLALFLSITAVLPHRMQANTTDYGLYIKAYPFNDQEKTTLVLENNRPLKLSEKTTLSFDLNVRKDNVFGIVFRIITDKKENIDLLFTVGENDKRYPILVINESVHMITHEIVCNEWTPVSITLSSATNEITLNYGGSQIEVPYTIRQAKNVKISFGLCPFEGYALYDLASVNIRNIKIIDGDNPIRFWKLDSHNETQTFDSIAHVPAITTNPRWIADIYTSWEKIYSKPVKEKTSFAFNSNTDQIYIVPPDSKEVITFNLVQKKEETLPVRDGMIAANAPNQLFFDPFHHQLISYNLDESIVSLFSFSTHSWDNHTKPVLESGYWNNSASYSTTDSMLVSFGGYGFYKYNNNLIRMDVSRKTIKKSSLPEILPRYAPSTTIVNNVLYVFGGRGNKSGRQELSPYNFYDFYAVNLLAEQTNKLWELPHVNKDFLPSENMVYDEKEDCFYVFTTMDGGTLLRLRKDQSTFECVSSPIYDDLTSHYLYMNLYYSPEQQKFYTLINKTKTDGSAEVAIYSLNYPPFTIQAFGTDVQSAEIKSTASQRMYIIYILASMAVIVCISYYLLRKKRIKTKIVDQAVKIEDKGGSVPVVKKADNRIKDATPPLQGVKKAGEMSELPFYDFSKQSICFLGGFNVMDRNGQNITGLFTPTLKQLLILLLLSTTKDAKGISGKKLIQLLWNNKNEEAAKNNRNVYLSNLRSILTKHVGNAEIINQNGLWTIHLNDIACDYTEVIDTFSVIKENTIPDQEVDYLIEILLKGVLLPNTETNWIDGFKSDFSNLTIDILTALSQGHYNNRLTDDLKLKIADTLFLHDFINEEALFLKCSIFFRSGKKGIAKIMYDNFSKEYSHLLGLTYKYSLTDVIERKYMEP